MVKEKILDNIRNYIIGEIVKSNNPLEAHIIKEDFVAFINTSWNNTFGKCVHVSERQEFIEAIIDWMGCRGILSGRNGNWTTDGETYKINPVLCYLYSKCKIFNR